MSVTVLDPRLWDIFYEPILWVKRQEYDTTLVFSVVIVACLAYQLIKNSKYKLPPGPVGLPIVGFMPFLKQNAYLQFLKLSKKYGDVFR